MGVRFRSSQISLRIRRAPPDDGDVWVAGGHGGLDNWPLVYVAAIFSFSTPVSNTLPEKVRAEFSLTALAYNLRRVLNLVGFSELMAALAV
jgi:hypothetical protein